MPAPAHPTVHPAWLPAEAFAFLAGRRVAVLGDPEGQAGSLAEIPLATLRTDLTEAGAILGDPHDADLILAVHSAIGESWDAWAAFPATFEAGFSYYDHGHAIAVENGRTLVVATDEAALLHAFFALVRTNALVALSGTALPDGVTASSPAVELRMLDHWDNMSIHPVMGQVERGYSGNSIFFDQGRIREDLSRVRDYARLLAAVGIDAVAINNVNVGRIEASLLTDQLGDVARVAHVFREYGTRTYLSVSFASPIILGGPPTADPLDPAVAAWWAETATRVYSAIPDFGGFLVKADSEGQPGPFAYDRTHADGANMLAAALEPHGGTVIWRAFVYNHTQDWRDRSTDRARAAYDHFTPLAGTFADNVVLQVKHGPMDFQVREPVSPTFAAMQGTRLALELQVTQEYTGQQKHACYLAPAWRNVLDTTIEGEDGPQRLTSFGYRDGIAAVSNVGGDEFWTGHPLAQANLYAFGRLAWDPELDPTAILDEWIALTFSSGTAAERTRLREAIHAILDQSGEVYESYTAPLGVGFMVRPGHHYGPDVDGYEYTPWGTYHFADRDGIGVDRTVATGTGFAGQYPSPLREAYESLETCPDELLLFFHHVPYTHVLHSGTTVIQHIYDSHADGVERVLEMRMAWESLDDLVGGAVSAELDARVRERLAEQVRSAIEWRDQIRSYFWRKSGIPDATGRPIY